MDRTIIYSQEQGRSFDLLSGYKDALKALSSLILSLQGTNTTTVSGFSAAAQFVPNMTINLAAGSIQQLFNTDTAAYGALNSDSTQIMQQGVAAAQTLSFSTGSLTAGQSCWAVVQCTFAQIDAVRASDPSGGVLPFYNSANPLQPLQGPSNSGAVQSTVRTGVASVSIILGTPATTGSQVCPSPSANNVPLFLILLTYGQTAITTGNILFAAPNAGTGVGGGYPYQPQLAGLLRSHHSGNAGQAPQINLATEVQGSLGLPHLPVTNSAPTATGGSVLQGGLIGIITMLNVAPTGNLAGNVGDAAFNELTGNLYFCTTSGSTSTAVWTQAAGSLVSYKNAPFTVAAGNNTYLCDSGVGTVTLPLTNTMQATAPKFINISATPLVFQPNGGEPINAGTPGSPVTFFNKGDSGSFVPQSGVGWWQAA